MGPRQIQRLVDGHNSRVHLVGFAGFFGISAARSPKLAGRSLWPRRSVASVSAHSSSLPAVTTTQRPEMLEFPAFSDPPQKTPVTAAKLAVFSCLSGVVSL